VTLKCPNDHRLTAIARRAMRLRRQGGDGSFAELVCETH
jgi:hypothetical protein